MLEKPPGGSQVGEAALTAFLHCDLGGVVRARLLSSRAVGRRLSTGAGWVPANLSLTPFGVISESDPHGPTGDVRLAPDPASHAHVDFEDGVPPLDLYVCDVVTTRGERWECCPRTFLSDALAALGREAGIQLLATFEHEFQFVDESAPLPPFSLVAHRRVEPFGTILMGALEQAGVDPEFLFPEYGDHQFELTCAPALGMAAADRSVIVKEIVRDVARLTGRRVTFAPLRSPTAVGNGAHIHFSLRDADDEPVMYDPLRPGGLSEVAGHFAAGVLAHAAALSAVANPGVASFLRLAPHRWSVGAACLGDRNRETLLRIAPVVEMGGSDPARQCNLELRSADATACPHLLLGAIVHAGLHGIRERMPCPPLLDRDPADLSPDELDRYGAVSLPRSLEEALLCLERDTVAREWLPPLLYETYVAVKRAEISILAGLDDEAVCARYAAVF